MGKLDLQKAYHNGKNLYWHFLKEMRDGKPICCQEDAGLLAQIIYNANGNHLEIGTAYGGSALIAIKAMDYHGRDDKVICIDPFGEDRRDTLHKAVEKEFRSNIKHFGVEDRIEHIKEFSHPLPIDSSRRFATALIDGDHDYEYVLNDWMNLKDIVNRYIMFHDYSSKRGVHKTVNEYAKQDKDWELSVLHGWSAVMVRV